MRMLKENYFLHLLLALVLCVTLVSQTRAEPTAVIVDGVTTITLSDDFIALLEPTSLTAGAFEPGTLDDTGIATFPIVAGALDLETLVGEIAHTGGLSLTAADGTNVVDLFNFTIDNANINLALTGLVAVNDDLGERNPLFKLDFTDAIFVTTSEADAISITGIVLNLTEDLASALLVTFGVAFTEDFNVGTMDVEAITQTDGTDTGA